MFSMIRCHLNNIIMLGVCGNLLELWLQCHLLLMKKKKYDTSICDLICKKGPLSVKTFVTWFVKNQLLKHLVLYTYSCYICITILYYVYKTVLGYVLAMFFFHKSGHKCFDRSGPFLRIRSHLVISQSRYQSRCNEAIQFI